MKYLLLVLGMWTTYAKAQQSDCYELLVKGSLVSNSKLCWNDIKISGPKDKLVNFLRTDKFFASCNYILQTPDQILNDAKKINCNSDIIHLEFKEPKDVLQLSKKLKEEKSQKPKVQQPKEKETPNSEGGSVEICLSSDGDISLSYGNEFGSIQVTSKGKFSITSKGNNGSEYKVEL